MQTIMYYVTDQPSLTQSGRSVLNFKLSVLTFLRLMSCSMSIEQKIVLSENISTPIYVECYYMYQSTVRVQEFWYFMSGVEIQLEQSKQGAETLCSS